ncbi:hypothetical protein [Oryzihumus leptocrescens]|uniref:hypothetical protein n=1 Tax=Oryzihumus leptocrescens TaxID=297536 RepID=UPI001FE450B5|nr:hypothetical protein [Oryzihumus leptocrescens]
MSARTASAKSSARWSTTWVAPSARAAATLSGPPTVAMPRGAPIASASWTAAPPTPPVAPWTRTVSPSPTCPRRSTLYAVTSAVSDAPTSAGTSCGNG